MTRLIPSEDELHAYIDERLAPVRRAEVQAWLAANPQAAARVEGWRADARRLRTALAGFGELPGAAQLDLGQVRRHLRQRRQRRWAAAAVVMRIWHPAISSVPTRSAHGPRVFPCHAVHSPRPLP